MSKLVRRLALTALAFALLVPAAAHAKGFEVSRDIGVYAGANTSKGIGTIRAGQTADVQCWTTGQRIKGYSIWDRVNYRGHTGYVHDLYVEMGGSPKDNDIPNCKDAGAAPQPGPNRCVGDKKTHYLAEIFNRNRGKPTGWDAWYQVRWTVQFCRRGNTSDYNVSGTPQVREYPSVRNFFVLIRAFDFQLGEPDPTPDNRKVVYTPRLRVCLTGKLGGGCGIFATMRLVATLQGSQVRIDRSVITTKLGRKLLANTNLVGWRHKQKG